MRCVLASDGLWDVVTLSSTAKILTRYKDPGDAAKALTEKAYKRRDKRGLRLDDITVTVVDIAPPEPDHSWSPKRAPVRHSSDDASLTDKEDCVLS